MVVKGQELTCSNGTTDCQELHLLAPQPAMEVLRPGGDELGWQSVLALLLVQVIIVIGGGFLARRWTHGVRVPRRTHFDLSNTGKVRARFCLEASSLESGYR
jgi:hypothetical protein